MKKEILEPSVKKIICFGELLWDLLPSGPLLGGAPGNVAFRLASLGDQAVLVSALGQDPLGIKLLEELAAHKFNVSQIQTNPNFPTGTVDVKLDAHGNPSFTINHNVAYDNIELSESLLNAAAQAEIFCYGTLGQFGAKSRATLEQVLKANPRATRVFDINLRKESYSWELVENCLKQAHILKLNSSEVRELAKQFGLPAEIRNFVAALFKRFPLEIVLVTLGEAGVYGRARSGVEEYLPGYQVTVADTIGSGDSFTAGFVHAFSKGCGLRECAELGNVLGTLAATKRGAMCQFSQAEIMDFHSAPSARIQTSL